jgi:hypothetical protein
MNDSSLAEGPTVASGIHATRWGLFYYRTLAAKLNFGNPSEREN